MMQIRIKLVVEICWLSKKSDIKNTSAFQAREPSKTTHLGRGKIPLTLILPPS